MKTDETLPRMDERSPRSAHVDSVATPAPGDLERVRSFLSLHDHGPESKDSLPPSPRSLEIWLRENGSIGPDDLVGEDDLRWGLQVRDALRAKVAENHDVPRDKGATEFLNRAAHVTGLSLCFGCHEQRLHTDPSGFKRAIGQLLGTAFLADLDGSWQRLRLCQGPTCTSVFYDRSKNHTGKWCSMATCGNRNKVRRFRERERSAVAGRDVPVP